MENLTGLTFERLTVLSPRGKDKYGHKLFLCKCSCGTEKVINGYSLINKKTRSCGCLNREVLHQKGENAIRTTHGLCGTRLHRIWKRMKTRCYNKNSSDYILYGSRGIKICDQWKKSFPEFAKWSFENGYKDNLTIDRINPNGDYSPENCRWATAKEQANNRRSNRFITIGYETKTIAEWVEYSGISKSTFCQRLQAGKSGQDLISKPRPRKRVV